MLPQPCEAIHTHPCRRLVLLGPRLAPFITDWLSPAAHSISVRDANAKMMIRTLCVQQQLIVPTLLLTLHSSITYAVATPYEQVAGGSDILTRYDTVPPKSYRRPLARNSIRPGFLLQPRNTKSIISRDLNSSLPCFHVHSLLNIVTVYY